MNTDPISPADLQTLHAWRDGELPAAEAEAFARRLAAEPALAAALRQREALDAALRSLPQPEPPGGLYGEIMSSARLPAGSPRFAWRSWWRPAVGFAAGAALAVGLAHIDDGLHATDPSALVGSLAGRDGLPARAPVGATELATAHAAGRITVWREGDLVLVGFDLMRADALSIEVPIDPALTRVTGYARLDGQPALAALDASRLQLSQDGAGKFALFLDTRADRLELEIGSTEGASERVSVALPRPN